MAFIDVVVDALMVQQSRKNFDHGSEDLQGLSWGFLAIGGVLGSIFAAFFTEYFQPRHSFMLSSVFGLIMTTFGFFISKAAEGLTEDNTRQKSGFMFNIKRNWNEVKIAVRFPAIYRTLLFFIL